ncbi:MAG: insulinase family protein [Bacteroidales bacterium]|nr:insulinase family protein [Bacteroidales bacterium]
MVNFDKFELDNGLKVIVHKDSTTPLVAVNILYNVGARDEDPDKTGFAHLFEHLMFGGSENIAKYDSPLEKSGGENNAFTNNDITNYYLTIPKQNLELAFWLESDRMLNLAFSEKSLEVQRNVVIEEFRQSYLNQPYGDVWLMLRPLAYKVHPYQWTTIGKEISHIEDARMRDVKDFYTKYYNPDNAVMAVAGNIEVEDIKQLAEKWFSPIKKRSRFVRSLPAEPVQQEDRKKEVHRNVPISAIYKAYHMCSRNDEAYHSSDLISDILSNGDSSRLFNRLVKEQKLFSDIQAYISGDIDQGLFIFTGKIVKGVSMQDAEKALNREIENIRDERISEQELEKVKNKIESTLEFSEMSVLNKAMNLAYSELIGDACLINLEKEKYAAVTVDSVKQAAEKMFRKGNSSTLYYFAN